MQHAIYRVVGFEITGPYALALQFDDGSEQRIDFQPVLEGPLYGPLRDPELFRAVTLDTEAGTVTWPNGADFDPTTLHDWPRVGAAFVSMVKRWPSQAASDLRSAG